MMTRVGHVSRFDVCAAYKLVCPFDGFAYGPVLLLGGLGFTHCMECHRPRCFRTRRCPDCVGSGRVHLLGGTYIRWPWGTSRRTANCPGCGGTGLALLTE
jgi:DnaJ-class molecular chaperone